MKKRMIPLFFKCEIKKEKRDNEGISIFSNHIYN